MTVVKDGDPRSYTWKYKSQASRMREGRMDKIIFICLLFKNMYCRTKYVPWFHCTLLEKSVCEVGCSRFCFLSVRE